MMELTEEDLFDVHEGAEWGELIPDDVLVSSQRVPLVVRYDLIDLEETDYSFSQHFHPQDTQMYFRRMKELCSHTIEEMFDKPREWHFRRTDVRGNLRKVLSRLHPEAVKNNPMIFHFALYTSPQTAQRSGDIRSPRIYFMLGAYGMIYILFFDPYHEINP